MALRFEISDSRITSIKRIGKKKGIMQNFKYFTIYMCAIMNEEKLVIADDDAGDDGDDCGDDYEGVGDE